MNALEQEHYTILGRTPFTLGEFCLASYKAREGSSASTPSGGRIVLLRQIAASSREASALIAASKAYASLPAEPRILRHYGLVAVSEDPTHEPDLVPGVYAISEWAQGITLRERIRRVAPFSLAAALNTAIEIVRALISAEASEVVHGYLTADEVLITSDGEVKVADFVLGRAAARMEQASAVSEDSLTACAALLYEMLTGKSASAARLPLAPKSEESGVPNALNGITQKASLGRTTGGYTGLAGLLADLQTAHEQLRQERSLDWTPYQEQAAIANPPPNGPAANQIQHNSAEVNDRAREDQVLAMSNIPNATQDTPTGQQIPAARIESSIDKKRDKASEEDDFTPARSPGSAVLRAIGIIIGSMFIIAAVFGCVYLALMVSNVPSDITVPSVVGKQFTDAKSQAAQQHFNIVELGHSNSDTWPEGAIYQQSPAPGRMIKSGKNVEVFVSDGPRLIDVPDLSQTTQEKAQAVLQDAGLPLGSVQSIYDNIVPKGIVTSQQPVAGSKVARDQAINLTVSKGPPPPAAPTNLSATCTLDGQIDLSWDQVPIATAYDIYRDGKKVQSGFPETQYSDVGLDTGKSYIYTVTAVDSNGESPASQPASSAALPAATATPPDASDSGDDTQAQTSDQDASAQPSAAPIQGAPKQRQFEVKFRVPKGSSYTRNVQIQVQDATGTNTAYNQDASRGTVVDQQVQGFGNRIILRIFIDGKLVKQETK